MTFFVVNMRSPGIDIRPIRQMSGKSDFNETFLTDVRIPADLRLGAEGEGWAVTMTVLMNERLGSAKEFEAYSVRRVIERARDTRVGGAALIERGDIQEHLARWYVQEQGIKYFRWRLITQLSKGQRPGAEGGLSKLLFTNRLQQTAAYAMEMLGYAGAVAEPDDRLQTMFFDNYIWSSALRVAGGADEVLRNQLAERVLGMPGEIRGDKNIPFDQLSSLR
jgi:acyl-CoA dehydrogenase